MSLRFHHRIETALPLQSADGSVEITGWCFLEGASQAPALRLSSARGKFEIAQRPPRTDVAAAFQRESDSESLGFKFTGELPAGAHELTLAASVLGSGDWQILQRFTAVVFSCGLQASIEFPAGSTVRESVRIQGWAAHPEETIREVFLHYGTRRIPCEFGLEREDLPRLLPTAPNGAASGFITRANSPAGRSSLRVAAIDAHGMRHIARTDRFIDIDRDEENPRGLRLPADAARLVPSVKGRSNIPSFPAAVPARKLRVLFILYGDFTSNSAIHVAALANTMIDAGHECLVAVPQNPETLSHHPRARFRAVTFAEVSADPGLFSGAQPPDVIHAWTTRENVRRFATSLRAATGAKLIVHLEDHELRILELNLGRSIPELSILNEQELDRLIPASLTHPKRGPEFLASADGVSVITDKLHELVPVGKNSHLFWPAADPDAFQTRPIPWDLRAALGLGPQHTVLFYHGNVHAANAREVRELYLAVADLNATGHPTTLLRTGRDFCDFTGTDAEELRRHVIELGLVEKHHHLGPLMALADFFVQPGEPDPFNDYRFPSKLPEFFASGRPVILPKTNLGQAVQHGQDAYVLEKADAAGIADAVRVLQADPALRQQLATGAAEFAERMFSWQRSAEGLLNFYLQLVPASVSSAKPPHV